LEIIPWMYITVVRVAQSLLGLGRVLSGNAWLRRHDELEAETPRAHL
jgi:hypothetical protein